MDIFDKNQALEQAGQNEALAKELFGMLLKELPEHLQAIEQALTDKQSPRLWDAAHKLYGSTAYCGVPALRRSAKNLEDSIKQADLNALPGCFKIVENDIRRLLEQGPALLEQPWSG